MNDIKSRGDFAKMKKEQEKKEYNNELNKQFQNSSK